jgi:hypothetical protein
MGGKGSISGTVIGALILGALRNGLTLMNVQAFYQLLATGVIILIAVFCGSGRSRKNLISFPETISNKKLELGPWESHGRGRTSQAQDSFAVQPRYSRLQRPDAKPLHG